MIVALGTQEESGGAGLGVGLERTETVLEDRVAAFEREAAEKTQELRETGIELRAETRVAAAEVWIL